MIPKFPDRRRTGKVTALNKSDRSGVNPRVAAPDVHTVMPGVQSEVNPRHRWQAAYVRRLAVSDGGQ